MRNPIFLSTLILAALLSAPMAQTPPQAISYQALVRDGAGVAVRNQAVGVRIRLHQDSAAAPVAYAETFTPSTNGFGNVNLAIGRGSVVSGTFSALDWSLPMYVEIGVDIAGGTAYTDLGTAQILSVPYAMYSGRSGTSGSAPASSEIRDADGNTRVSTERSPNENIIRFDLNGAEKMRLRGNALELPNSGQSVYIGDSAGVSVGAGNLRNAFVGYRSGRSNTTGSDNTFLGSYSGFANTTGTTNVFVGAYAGYLGPTGNRNTFAGYGAGLSNTGSSNTYVGFGSGASNTSGSRNMFVGDSAGFSNITGNYNTFSGANSGASNNTGGNNAFFGYNAGGSNTTASGNTFIGYNTGGSNTTGTQNTFLGLQAGYWNSTGGQNTFTGHNSGFNNSTGAQNIFTGHLAGFANTTGNQNVFSGMQSGYSTTSGNTNTFYGHVSGFYNTTGSRNTYLGLGAGPASGNGADSANIFIGYAATAVGSNKLSIDNSSDPTPLIWGDFLLDSVRINGGMSVARSITATAFNVGSDRRLKDNIQPVSNALDGVGKINGVYYNYKAKAPDGNPYPQSRQIGVIAQDVEKVYPELVATQPGGYKAVDYPKLTAVLIEAVKELNGKVQALEMELRQARTGKSGDEVAKR